MFETSASPWPVAQSSLFNSKVMEPPHWNHRTGTSSLEPPHWNLLTGTTSLDAPQWHLLISTSSILFEALQPFLQYLPSAGNVATFCVIY